MNYEESYTHPRARHWTVPLFVGIVAGLSMPFITADWLRVGLIALVIVCGVWALVNGGYHVAWIIFRIRNEAREIDWKFSEKYALTILSQMNESQLKAYRAGHHVIERWVNVKGEPVDKLGGADVYLYLAWYMLVNSTEYNLMPINRFKPETYHFDLFGDHAVDDYQQARNFTLWLDRNGYVHWSLGNNSATWKKGVTPELVLKHLGIDVETYKQNMEE